MLGNFSFGDYFKRDAIAYAWELLTVARLVRHPDKTKLYVTIFEGEGSASHATPRPNSSGSTQASPPSASSPCPAKDNFWQMGDTGPCGPCSEIFYDLGLEAAEPAPEEHNHSVPKTTSATSKSGTSSSCSSTASSGELAPSRACPGPPSTPACRPRTRRRRPAGQCCRTTRPIYLQHCFSPRPS